ncbi:MAG: UbiD family decarboxylase [Bacillota bacterium]
MSKDLRSFIQQMEQTMPQDFLKIKKEVNPRFELCAVLRKFQESNQFPAVFYENVKGTKMPVIANTLAARERLALALETTSHALTKEYAGRQHDLKPVMRVDHGPVKEIVLSGGAVDVTSLPQVVHCEKDGGPYISSGIMILKDPDSGVYNMGIYRIQIKSKNKLGIYFGAYSHAAHIFRKFEERGEVMELAIAIGHHPAVYLGAQYRGPFEISELEVTGGLLGEPLRMVKGETVDLDVPADAEIVIEGRIPPGVREMEGPFGEYTWYMGDALENPIIEVTAVTHRRDAIYYDIFSAHPEHNLTGLLGREAILWERLKASIPTVKQVVLPFSGTCRHTVYVSIKKEYDGLGKNAALAALAGDPFMKMAVVVDDDIDVLNESEVLWAICTRVQADRDVFIIPDAYVCELDPSAYDIKGKEIRGYLNCKWAIDATKPVEIPFQERAEVPEDMWKNLDLKYYLES